VPRGSKKIAGAQKRRGKKKKRDFLIKHCITKEADDKIWFGGGNSMHFMSIHYLTKKKELGLDSV
jgi:hypothetical protein